MPKIKTSRAAAKRFKKTGTGKLKRKGTLIGATSVPKTKYKW